MADRKYYCFCDSNCKYETLTREQILTAITQAVETGKVQDCDTGFITSVKTINGFPLRFFVGTQSEYETLGESQKRNLFAIITNDTSKEALFEAIEGIRSEFDAYTKGIAEGRIVVPKATSAVNATDCINATNAVSAEKATKDGNGNTISETYGNFKNSVTVQASGSYTLPSEGYYHIKAFVTSTDTVDFGIIEYNGTDVEKCLPFVKSGNSVAYYTLRIGSDGAVSLQKYADGTSSWESVNIRVRKIL